MGNQQSKWKRRAHIPFFKSSPYVLLGSSSPSSQAQSLLDPYCPLEANHPQLPNFSHVKTDEDYKRSIEALSKKTLNLEKKVDELTQKVDKLQLRQPKDVKDHGSDIKKIHDKISTLELGINKMKDRVIMLEVRSINGSLGNGIQVATMGEQRCIVESQANKLQSEIMPLHSTASNGTEEIERQITIRFDEDLRGGLIIVIFLISLLIGMLMK